MFTFNISQASSVECYTLQSRICQGLHRVTPCSEREAGGASAARYSLIEPLPSSCAIAGRLITPPKLQPKGNFSARTLATWYGWVRAISPVLMYFTRQEPNLRGAGETLFKLAVRLWRSLPHPNDLAPHKQDELNRRI